MSGGVLFTEPSVGLAGQKGLGHRACEVLGCCRLNSAYGVWVVGLLGLLGLVGASRACRAKGLGLCVYEKLP